MGGQSPPSDQLADPCNPGDRNGQSVCSIRQGQSDTFPRFVRTNSLSCQQICVKVHGIGKVLLDDGGRGDSDYDVRFTTSGCHLFSNTIKVALICVSGSVVRLEQCITHIPEWSAAESHGARHVPNKHSVPWDSSCLRLHKPRNQSCRYTVERTRAVVHRNLDLYL